jgi:hypothetical protein
MVAPHQKNEMSFERLPVFRTFLIRFFFLCVESVGWVRGAQRYQAIAAH